MGPQEEFYGCSDISIQPKLTTKTTQSSTKPTTTQTTKTHFTTTTPKETTSSGTPSYELEKFCVDKTNGFYPHPESCYMFIDCYNGDTFIKSCPTGLAWNSEKNYCDREQNVPACFNWIKVLTASVFFFERSQDNFYLKMLYRKYIYIYIVI